MADLTRPDRGEAMGRLTSTLQGLADDLDRVAYLLVVAGILAVNAPDVLTFLLDQADVVAFDGEEST